MFEESLRLVDEIERSFEEAIKDESCRRILVNAMEVFLRKGFTGARISDIAEVAGFSQGFVYNHFKSKDDIFTALATLAAGGGKRIIDYAASLAGSGYRKLYWLTEAILAPQSLAKKHFALLILCAASPEAIPEEARSVLRASAMEPIAALVPIIKQGQQEDELIKENPALLAVTYFSFMQGVVSVMLQSGGDDLVPPVEWILGFLKK